MSYEAIRQWCQTFGLDYARRLRSRRGRMGDIWYLDELFVKIQGRRRYLRRAVGQDGDVIDILVQARRDRQAAMRFFRKLLRGQGHSQRFLSVHGSVQNLFRVGRHMLRSAHHRLLRTRAFVEWDAVTCVC